MKILPTSERPVTKTELDRLNLLNARQAYEQNQQVLAHITKMEQRIQALENHQHHTAKRFERDQIERVRRPPQPQQLEL